MLFPKVRVAESTFECSWRQTGQTDRLPGPLWRSAKFTVTDRRVNMYVTALMMNWAAKCPPQHAEGQNRWSYSTVRTASRPTNSRNRPTWHHPSVHMDFIRLGSVTTNCKNGLTGNTTCCRYGLSVRKYVYWAQSNVFRTYGRMSRGLFPIAPSSGRGRRLAGFDAPF